MQSHNKPKKKKDNTWKSSEIAKSSISSDWKQAKEYFIQHPEQEYLPYSVRLKNNKFKSRDKETKTFSLFSKFPTMHSFFKLKNGEIYRRAHKIDGFVGEGGNGKVIKSYKNISQENENIQEEIAVLKVGSNKEKYRIARKREAAVLEDLKFLNTDQPLSSGSVVHKEKYYTHMQYTGIPLISVLAEGNFVVAGEKPSDVEINVIYLYLHQNEIKLLCKPDEDTTIEKNIDKQALGIYYKKYDELLSNCTLNIYIRNFTENLNIANFQFYDLVPFPHEVKQNLLAIYLENDNLYFTYHDTNSRFNILQIDKNIDNYDSIYRQVIRSIKNSTSDNKSHVWLNPKSIIQYYINDITKKTCW